VTAVAPTAVRPRLRWWREIVYVLAFYGVYTLVRNRGLTSNGKIQAQHNAERVIRVERFVHGFHEAWVQHLFYPSAKWFLEFWNVFYGSAHFIVTVVALVWLFRRDPSRYPLWRNTLAFTTGVALIGFAFFPLMPPRLLPAHYHFVDTLQKVGGLWSFDSGTMQKLSNQYAAMPSLHFGWSSWCAFVLYPMVKRRWLKPIVALYPFITLFAIVVTANHYWLDAVGGAVALSLGFLLARWFTAYTARLRALDGTHVDGVLDTFEATAASPAEGDAVDAAANGGPHIGGGQDLTAPR
jgi:PAP2 superfamily protein